MWCSRATSTSGEAGWEISAEAAHADYKTANVGGRGGCGGGTTHVGSSLREEWGEKGGGREGVFVAGVGTGYFIPVGTSWREIVIASIDLVLFLSSRQTKHQRCSILECVTARFC